MIGSKFFQIGEDSGELTWAEEFTTDCLKNGIIQLPLTVRIIILSL